MKSDQLSVNISVECWGVSRNIGLGAMYQPTSQLSVGQCIDHSVGQMLVESRTRMG